MLELGIGFSGAGEVLAAGNTSPGARTVDVSATNPRLTRTGTTMGTAAYMSPEQIRGEQLDGRTDLFSFGLVLYEMATGRQAFAGETAAVIHEAILHRPPTQARELNPELPAKLEEIINKALEKDREVRYQHASEMRGDLKGLKSEADIKPRAGVTPLHGRRQWPLVIVIVLAGAALAGLVMVLADLN